MAARSRPVETAASLRRTTVSEKLNAFHAANSLSGHIVISRTEPGLMMVPFDNITESSRTACWRKPDSNHRSRVTPPSF